MRALWNHWITGSPSKPQQIARHQGLAGGRGVAMAGTRTNAPRLQGRGVPYHHHPGLRPERTFPMYMNADERGRTRRSGPLTEAQPRWPD